MPNIVLSLLVELYNEVTCGAYVSASLFWQGLEIPSFKHFISNSRTHTLPREMGKKQTLHQKESQLPGLKEAENSI
jgi:hypothetical protein